MNKYLWKPSEEKVENSLLEEFSKYANFNSNKIHKIKDMARRLGLGDVTGIDLPGEKKGLIPSHEWKLANKGKVWTPGETVVSSIGQGYVLTTPLQLAVMTSRLANGKIAVAKGNISPSKK